MIAFDSVQHKPVERYWYGRGSKENPTIFGLVCKCGRRFEDRELTQVRNRFATHEEFPEPFSPKVQPLMPAARFAPKARF